MEWQTRYFEGVVSLARVRSSRIVLTIRIHTSSQSGLKFFFVLGFNMHVEHVTHICGIDQIDFLIICVIKKRSTKRRCQGFPSTAFLLNQVED